MGNRDGIADRLRAGPYAEPALTPATPWLAEAAPQPPGWRRITADGAPALLLQSGDGPPLRQAVLWTQQAGRWHWQAVPLPQARPLRLPQGHDAAWLVGIGRSGLESRPLRL